MLEIEKKFLLKEGDEVRLIDGAEFVSDKRMEDVYFDDTNWSLTTKDWWLRKRDGKFELKEPMHQLGHSKRALDQYREHITDEDVLNALKIKNTGEPIDEVLKKNGYEPDNTYCYAEEDL